MIWKWWGSFRRKWGFRSMYWGGILGGMGFVLGGILVGWKFEVVVGG